MSPHSRHLSQHKSVVNETRGKKRWREPVDSPSMTGSTPAQEVDPELLWLKTRKFVFPSGLCSCWTRWGQHCRKRVYSNKREPSWWEEIYELSSYFLPMNTCPKILFKNSFQLLILRQSMFGCNMGHLRVCQIALVALKVAWIPFGSSLPRNT